MILRFTAGETRWLRRTGYPPPKAAISGKWWHAYLSLGITERHALYLVLFHAGVVK